MAAANVRLHYDPLGQLVLTDAQGRTHVGVAPIRAFPLSDQDQWIAICDNRGHELAMIPDPAALPADVREILATELASREFLPVIERVTHVSGSSEPCEWHVQTDRGPTRFLLKSEDNVRRIGPHRALITDADGVRYLVADARKLDAFSRRTLERYI